MNEIINKRKDSNKKENEYVDVSKHIKYHTFIISTILLLITFMVFIHKWSTNNEFKKSNKINTLFSFMTVSLIMTILETCFVYWYNVSEVYNQIVDKLSDMTTFNEYIAMKIVYLKTPRYVFDTSVKTYEDKLYDSTFLLFFPITIIMVFMISYFPGTVNIYYTDIISIIINILLLATTFGATFVNLGEQTVPFDVAKHAKNFDPLKKSKRFSEKTNALSETFVISMGSFFLLCLFILLFIRYNSEIKTLLKYNA